MEPSADTRARAATVPAARIAGLDGIRGTAALFVVLNHVFLRAFPGYPADHAPLWAAGFLYGRFAVVVFIVLSGFSLALAAARAGWRLPSIARYARRRAWRILPPYWAALAFSLLMTWFVVAQPGWPVPDARSVGVNGLLLQDVFAAASPNRAFWSIAIEAQLYVLFPLLVLVACRLGPPAMVLAVAGPVVGLGIAGAGHVAAASRLIAQYTPDLAVLFAIGVAAAGIVTASEPLRSRPWKWLALALVVPVFGIVGRMGSVWTVGHFFWIDMTLGPAVGCLLAAIATGQPRSLVQALDVRPLRSLGSFSYSLYLTHAPIVIAVYYGFLQGRVPPGAPTFLVLAAIVLPLTVLFARAFAELFELPFQRISSRRPVPRTNRPRPYTADPPRRSGGGR